MDTHAAVAVLAADPGILKAVLADWRTAPVSPGLRAILGFLEALTLRPHDMSARDIGPLRAAGLSDEAIREAIYVCFLFNVMNRLSDAFGFDLPDEAGVRRIGRTAHRLGYSLAILPG